MLWIVVVVKDGKNYKKFSSGVIFWIMDGVMSKCFGFVRSFSSERARTAYTSGTHQLVYNMLAVLTLCAASAADSACNYQLDPAWPVDLGKIAVSLLD